MIFGRENDSPQPVEYSPPRFSLKQLLIAMTIVAISLAALMWFANSAATRVPPTGVRFDRGRASQELRPPIAPTPNKLNPPR